MEIHFNNSIIKGASRVTTTTAKHILELADEHNRTIESIYQCLSGILHLPKIEMEQAMELEETTRYSHIDIYFGLRGS